MLVLPFRLMGLIDFDEIKQMFEVILLQIQTHDVKVSCHFFGIYC